MFAQRPMYVVRSQRKIPEWRSSFGVIGVTVNALPIAHSKNTETITAAAVAVCRGTMDIAPADPVEGILIAQLMAANEASVAMYSKGWAQPPEYFQARTGGGRRYEIEMTINPMQSAHDARRCKAKSKRTGKPCRAPAVRGCRVCRMHGARGGASTGKRNGNYRRGARTKEAIQAVRHVNLLSRLARKS
jgi:hypothetical protein